jgi:flagellar biosynthesis/type III secretory pathway protein FliH
MQAEPAPEQARSDRRLIEEALARLEVALNNRLQIQQRQLEQWRQAALELAMAAMGMVLHRQIETGEFQFEQIIRDMLASCPGGAAISIHLNPSDAHAMRNRLFGRPLFPDRAGEVHITEDPSLARGDCRVDDGQQVFLTQLGERLREIREELNRSLGHVPA